MKEQARLEVYSDRKSKSGLAYMVSLNHYVDIKTLVCKELKSGDIIIPIDFTLSGSPKFSKATFEKYANGESYPNIQVECEFEEKDLSLPSSLFDNEERLKKYIVNLKTLHEIMEIRYLAGYKKKLRMQSFKLLDNKILLDSSGNAMVTNEDGSYSPKEIPTDNDVCPCCKKSWNLYNFLDFFEEDGVFYHKKCNLFRKLQMQKKEFAEIFKTIYKLNDLDFEAIPNRYNGWEGYSPWFIVHTPDGDIEIGRRKRVISITWLDSYKEFAEQFSDEDVTKEKRYIHAWGTEKCVEYLRRAKDSILN